MKVFLDSFSGSILDLKPKQRTKENALAVLAKDPRVSTWDMSEYPWVRNLIEDLLRDGKIVAEDEPYPWHRYRIVNK